MFESIKSIVTVPMALERYCNWNGKRRFACPIHGGNDPNFSIMRGDERWNCFVCNAGGDVVRLVAKLNNVSDGDAATIIERDFGLQSPEDMKRAMEDHKRIQERRRREDECIDKAWNVLTAEWWRGEQKSEYIGSLLELWIELDRDGRLRWCKEHKEFLRMVGMQNAAN